MAGLSYPACDSGRGCSTPSGTGIPSVLGHSWPADGWWEDFLKNRAGTLGMAAALASVLGAPDRSHRA